MMLKMNLGIEMHYCPIMMPTIQDLELLPRPDPDASPGSHPAPVAGETDVRPAFLPSSYASMG